MTTFENLKRCISKSDIGECCYGTKAVERSGKERLKAGRLLLAGKGCAEVAQAVGVARQTVYTWKGEE